jgi:DNA-directed RNA polymerase specialized sigma24 family protein
MRQKQSLFEELLLPHLDGAYNLARWIVERDQVAQAVVQEAYIQALKEFVESRSRRSSLATDNHSEYRIHLDSEAWQSFKHDLI